MLRPDVTRPWIWTNDAWKPNSQGTFAVIIGVSDYAHLDGSARCFGMDKLFVSALTARRFFEWMASTYQWTDCPVAKCWLLLAPTAEELAAVPHISQNAILPEFPTCQDAIQQWYAEMTALPLAVAKRSRSVFFFSGHGLEILPERQVLLPLDYLKPQTSLDRALSTQNLARGLRALPVPLHFVFLDACRNDHSNLDQFEPLAGTKILNEPSTKAVNPDAVVPIFYGSASGTQAFQPTDPALGLSLFGEALLDGLRAKGLSPDCTSGVCLIDLIRLRPFVDSRIAEIVSKRYSQTLKQRARVHGDQTEEAVTEVPPPTAGPEPRIPGSPQFLTTVLHPVQMPPSEAIRPTPLNEKGAHDFFGSERITKIWVNDTRVFDYATQTWIPKGLDIEISALRRDVNSTAFVFDLMIPAAQKGRSYWFELNDEVQRLGCILPIDQDARTLFRFEMEFAQEPRTVTRLDVSLSPENEGDLGFVARMWQASSDFGSQESIALRDSMLPVTKESQRSSFPLVALTAASVLLRYRRWDMVRGWLQGVPGFVTDGAVLRAELCLRTPADDGGYEDALRYFLTMDGRDLPSLAEPSGYALQQAELFRSDTSLTTEQHLAIDRIHARLVKALGMFRSGGLFATFAGPADRLSPALITPEASARAKVQEADAKEEESNKREKAAGAGA